MWLKIMVKYYFPGEKKFQPDMLFSVPVFVSNLYCNKGIDLLV